MTKGRWRLLDYLGLGVFGHWLLLGLAAASPADSVSQAVEFNRDIRPILSDKCFTCHGPDPSQRMSKLRLDTEAGAFADLGEKFAVVPGEPARSEMYRRISSSDPAVKMPPAFSGRTLAAPEIELIRRWIEQGAKWQTQHWSFIPPRAPALPEVRDRSWPRVAIDFFVLERLERDGFRPSPEADKATLIRRVSLDLTGLPPTPAEIDGFLQDPSPNAYGKVVDRLLDSPRYGERMATRWLDAARYADTNGYQTDAERSMWRWRDWVIDAFNRNMPFDQFTIEQIAGDMLPNPTLEQRIATGFNRNHRGNGEGGIIPEEYAVEYVVDRLETTSTVWLGLTLGCARCHDHKYDPFTQKDFYRLFAYFNNVPEKGRANKYGNSAAHDQSSHRRSESSSAGSGEEAGGRRKEVCEARDCNGRSAAKLGKRVCQDTTGGLVRCAGTGGALPPGRRSRRKARLCPPTGRRASIRHRPGWTGGQF